MMFACVVISDFLLAIAMRTQLSTPQRLCVLLDGRGRTVIDASPAARKLGVISGLIQRKARSLCPSAYFLKQDDAESEKTTLKLLEVLEGVSPTLEVLEPGCVLCDLGREEDSACLYREGKGIIQAIQAALLLRSKVGMAETRFVAGLAVEDARPGECTVVSAGDETAFLASQKVESLPVEAKIREKLQLLGIDTLGQISSMAQKHLSSLFGLEGKRLMDLVHGIDPTPIKGLEEVELLSDSLDLEDGCITGEAIIHGLCLILEKLFARLKKRHKLCAQIRIDPLFDKKESFCSPIRLRLASPTVEVCRVEGLLREQLSQLQFEDPPAALRLTLDGLLAEYAQQLDFTEAAAKTEKLRHVQRVLERLEGRAGSTQLMHVVWNDPQHRVPERRAHLEGLGAEAQRKALLIPKPAMVAVMESGVPYMLRTRSGWQPVSTVIEAWELDEEWWAQRPIMRAYWRLYLRNGGIVRVFRDRINGCWYQQTS